MNQFESAIRDYLSKNLECLEPNLQFVEKEFKLKNSAGAGGSIDILAKDDLGHFVVIEIKRSDQAARAALHELTKYVALLKSTLGVQAQKIRALLISTEWHELAVPFSEYIKAVETPTEGLQIEAQPNGEVTRVRRFHPVTLEKPLHIERAQHIYLYENAENCDQVIGKIAQAAREASIQDFAILRIDYHGDNKRVIYRHAAYFLFSAPVDYSDEPALANFVNDTGINWEELELLSENFTCWMQNFEEFDYDDLEIGFPEKLLSMLSSGWQPRVSYRAGRYEANSSVMSDDSLIKEATNVESGAVYYLYKTASPRFSPSWISFKSDIAQVVQGCQFWANFLDEILEKAENSVSPPTLSLGLYHYGDLPQALAKAAASDELGFFSSLQLVESSAEGVNLYLGRLAWSSMPSVATGEEFINCIYSDVMDYFLARHHGEHREFYDRSCAILGLESVIFKISNPGSSLEKIDLLRANAEISKNRPVRNLKKFLKENQSFLLDLIIFLRSHSSNFI